MARYRGKHRKPSSTGRTLSRVAITGAVAAAPLAAAIPASAASQSTWDAVAQCESGGNWHTSTGNGFYGGLQFTQSTWSAYGGSQYSSNPAQASREQQIAVAERVLQAQGPGAWPVCSKKAGLSKGSLDNQSVSGGSGAAKAAPKKAKPAPQPHKEAKPANPGAYTVAAGDTLSAIAQHLGTDWNALLDKNKDTISNPNMIFPGQQLKTN